MQLDLQGYRTRRLLSPGAIALLLVLGSLGGCSSQELVDPPVIEVVEEAQPETSAGELQVPDGVDPVRVLLAFVLMSSGDIEAAISEGLVTPEEVAIAVTAIEDETIQEWISIAERSVSGDGQ